MYSIASRREVMMKRFGRMSATALAISAMVLAGNSTAAPPQRVIPMEAVFGPGSIIGVGGTYSHGDDGVECDINLNGGDFRLNINNNRARYLIADLSQSINPNLCSVVSPPPTPWASPLTDISFVNVNQIKDMPVSLAWVEKGAFFMSRSAGQLRFAQRNLDPFCSTTVQVQHPSDNTWIVRAADTERAVLVQSYKNQVVPVGYFLLPFEMTLTIKQ